MNNKSLNRMKKKVHQINNGPLSFPITIKKIKPLDQQSSYNPKLREFFGPVDYDIVAITSGVFSAFKQSETWAEIGTLSIHDWKCSINHDIEIDTNYIVIRTDTNESFEVLFKRQYIGETVIGLRPVIR